MRVILLFAWVLMVYLVKMPHLQRSLFLHTPLPRHFPPLFLSIPLFQHHRLHALPLVIGIVFILHARLRPLFPLLKLILLFLLHLIQLRLLPLPPPLSPLLIRLRFGNSAPIRLSALVLRMVLLFRFLRLFLSRSFVLWRTHGFLPCARHGL